ncbi:MAG TPA: hypothetical protein VFV38_35020 [Ktedonobacteraceae bacterium]|nr:hypothetical protein [Ktedonobacteraceae bacterium]
MGTEESLSAEDLAKLAAQHVGVREEEGDSLPFRVMAEDVMRFSPQSAARPTPSDEEGKASRASYPGVVHLAKTRIQAHPSQKHACAVCFCEGRCESATRELLDGRTETRQHLDALRLVERQ